MEDIESHKLRLAIFDWLQQCTPANNYVMDWAALSKGFIYNGEIVTLIGARGIWKPRQFSDYPISITSVRQSMYADEFIGEDILSYSYRGSDVNHPDNVGLRNAMQHAIPLIYFHQIVKGKYMAAWPVYVVGDEPDKLKFTISAESNEVLLNENMLSEPAAIYRRKYATREVLIRLHQGSFRERVLLAYKDHCAMCHLKHRELLDAAHIIPDSQGGSPEISNGLSLCKIHHAAYDQNIIGISPDYQIEVREDILHEVDGPMLKHGIQEINKTKLRLPKTKIHQPRKEWLDVRYKAFRSA
ncbi:MAG: HNH endonuclease [Reichenbachiella sp.]|uniref:HNH endonuclease n=1 Tax=Reichenbachiella sp. TaxID=2184521 RepID=UPI00329808AD